MKIKLDANGNAVLSDGMPVYVDDKGRETAVDVPALMTSAREHKRAATDRERELADLAAKLDAATKGGANDAERVKAAYEAQLAELKAKAEAAEASRAKALKNAALAGSKFLAERVTVPAEMIAATYGDHIAVDGDNVVVRDASGQVLHSRSNPLKPASLDEGLELLITQSPYADRILRGTQKPGSGTPPNGGGGSGAGLRLTRQQFDGMNAKERAAAMQSGAQLID